MQVRHKVICEKAQYEAEIRQKNLADSSKAKGKRGGPPAQQKVVSQYLCHVLRLFRVNLAFFSYLLFAV